MDTTDALIIIFIILLSTLLGFWQEKTAGDAVSQLLNMIRIKASVWRDGKKIELPVEEIVPGDVISLSAGNIIPAGCLLKKAVTVKRMYERSRPRRPHCAHRNRKRFDPKTL